MRSKYLTLILSICIVFSNCTDQQNKKIDTIVDISAIANKPIEEVNRVLGKPDTIIKINPIIKVNPVGTPNVTVAADQVFYKNKNIEVVYINKVAEWITITNVPNLPMTEYMITSLGLPQTNPTIYNPAFRISWEEIPGIQEISFFSKDSSTVDNIYIRVNALEN